MLRRFFVVSMLLATLGACTGGPFVGHSDPRPDMAREYTLVGLNFSAQPGLRVSEENGYYPQAEVVWRGDPPGDRIAQVAALFQQAARRNFDTKAAGRRVVVDVVLERFHGLTERTQYSVGGVYNIIFSFAVRDAASGVVIEPARRIVANLDGPGGNAAVALEQRGQTQKVRVTDFLANVIATELQ